MTPDEKLQKKIEEFIRTMSYGLHLEIGETIDKYITELELKQDAVTLNIVFNALSNSLAAIVENNADIPEETVEVFSQTLELRMFNAYCRRKEKEKAAKTQ